MQDLANQNGISLNGLLLFFYRAYELQWDESGWTPYPPERKFQTNIVQPSDMINEGFDVVTFTSQTGAECSPLSCNQMAEKLAVNEHCLLSSFLNAKQLVEVGTFEKCEPGPYRIFEVNRIQLM